MKIMKMNGSIIEMKFIKTKSSINSHIYKLEYKYNEYVAYDWVSGEQEYNLIYDKDGDLFGVNADIDEDTLDDIVDQPWNYDFPSTLNEYKETCN